MSAVPAAAPIRVPDAARDAAAAALEAVAELGPALPDTDVRPYLEHGAKQLRNHLPGDVLEALSAWHHAATPWLTLSNLPGPVRPVPTPRDGFCDEALLKVPNLVHFGLLRLLGLTPISYVWENKGRLVRNVAPRADAARTHTSWGYAHHLGWHTDDSVLDHRTDVAPSAAIPHFLSFYGMRNTEQVPTDLLPVDTVLAALPERVTGELRRPQYAVTAPESYAAVPGGEPPARTEVPLLWTLPDGRNALRYGPGRITGQTPWARAALRWFEECVAGMEGVPVMVEAGAFHLFDNRRVMHRRVSFEPAAPGHARWLRRCYATRRATTAGATGTSVGADTGIGAAAR
jgi:L-asparagine oxygenase